MIGGDLPFECTSTRVLASASKASWISQGGAPHRQTFGTTVLPELTISKEARVFTGRMNVQAVWSRGRHLFCLQRLTPIMTAPSSQAEGNPQHKKWRKEMHVCELSK